MARIFTVGALLAAPGGLLFLLMGSPQPGHAAPTAQASIEEAARAVVRIRGCMAAVCDDGRGSGAIIHPGGVILTAWHVTVIDPQDLVTPTYLDDFVVEMTGDVRRAPVPRYRAQLLAVNPQADLALLRIYWDAAADQAVAVGGPDDLPTLAISADIPATGQLRIMGYPPAGGSSIKYPAFELSGFAEEGALLTVQGTLSEGFSGGPALLERDGHFEIVGLVIRRRGSLGEVGLIRSVDRLQGLNWLPDARRAWGEHVQAVVQEVDGAPTLQISLDIHALDFVGGQGRLLAYAFDAESGRPWSVTDTSLPQAPNGQLVLRRSLDTGRFVEQLPGMTLTVPLSELGATPDRLAFWLLLWDASEARVLWQGREWVRARPAGEQVALAPTGTPTPTATPRATVTPTHTPTPVPTKPPAPTPTPPTPVAGATRVSPVDGAVYVFVPAGEFTMGSNEGNSDEKPVHTVYVDAFWIGRTEVTNAQWRAFVEAGGYAQPELWTAAGWEWRESSGATEPECWDEGRYGDEEWFEAITRPDHPVACVSWYEAVAYARWLAERSGWPVRLPTEAEWEKAASWAEGQGGGGAGEQGSGGAGVKRRWPWGDEPPDGSRLNYCDRNCQYGWKDEDVDDGYPYTAPVGSYPAGASPYGALDMAGNVWEWTSTFYLGYPYRADEGREEMESSDCCRVVRGGSWYVHLVRARPAYRFLGVPDVRFNFLGVRVVVAAPR